MSWDKAMREATKLARRYSPSYRLSVHGYQDGAGYWRYQVRMVRAW